MWVVPDPHPRTTTKWSHDRHGAQRRAVPCLARIVLLSFGAKEALDLSAPCASARRERLRGILSSISLIHTCYRILEIDRSVAFYEALGFRETARVPIRDEAINVYMGLADDGPEARLELTYNIYRVEPYEIGTGYGHIAVSVSDLDATLMALAERGIEPERPPYTIGDDSSLLCFVHDPDGYRVELIERRLARK